MKSNFFTCRLCDKKNARKSILTLNGMPIAAQHFLNEDQIKTQDESIDLDILQCTDCGLVQLDIEPVSYYKSVITAASISGDTKSSRYNQMLDFKNKFNLEGKKIVEIGCGTGAMLDVIQEAGMQAYGLEYSKISILEGKKKNRKIIEGYLEDIDEISEIKFDAFVCYNFLEHIPNINLFLKKIYKNIIDDGVGLITVPNLNYLIDTKSFYEFVPDHLSYFIPETIKHLFQKNKFQIVDCHLINNSNDILITVKKLQNFCIKKKEKPIIFDLKKNYSEVQNLIDNLKQISKKYKHEGKKIAVWGAGHRTLALLALSKFKDIEFIIDSAEFKQGKYSPINYTKIVGPEILKKKIVDLIIVMLPGIYPDEVIKKIKNMKLDIELAKLNDNQIEFITL